MRNSKKIKSGSEDKTNKLGLCVLILSIIICMFAVSYAIWIRIYEGTKTNSIDTATLIMTFDNSENNAINLREAIPVSDKKGLTYEPYTFTLRNSGTVNAKYRLMIVNDTDSYNDDDCYDNKLDWSNIRYSFQKGNETSTKGYLSDTAGILDTGIIGADERNSYRLRLWIKDSATNEIMNQHFHGIIKVEAIQEDQELSN